MERVSLYLLQLSCSVFSLVEFMISRPPENLKPGNQGLLLQAAASCLFVCVSVPEAADGKVPFFQPEPVGTSLPNSLYWTHVGVRVGGGGEGSLSQPSFSASSVTVYVTLLLLLLLFVWRAGVWNRWCLFLQSCSCFHLDVINMDHHLIAAASRLHLTQACSTLA